MAQPIAIHEVIRMLSKASSDNFKSTHLIHVYAILEGLFKRNKMWIICTIYCNVSKQTWSANKIFTTTSLVILVLRHDVWPDCKISQKISKFGRSICDNQLLFPALLKEDNHFTTMTIITIHWRHAKCYSHFHQRCQSFTLIAIIEPNTKYVFWNSNNYYNIMNQFLCWSGTFYRSIQSF